MTPLESPTSCNQCWLTDPKSIWCWITNHSRFCWSGGTHSLTIHFSHRVPKNNFPLEILPDLIDRPRKSTPLGYTKVQTICAKNCGICVNKYIIDVSFLKHYILNFWHTLRLRSLRPLPSVWYKTIVNTGGVGWAGTDPQTWKKRPSFLMSLALSMPILNNFQ